MSAATTTGELLDRAVAADDENRPVLLSELLPLPQEDHPDIVGPQFLKLWNEVVDEWKAEKVSKNNSNSNNEPTTLPNDSQKQDQPSMVKAVYRLVKWQFWLSIFTRTLHDACTIGLSFLLREYVRWLGKTDQAILDNNEWEGFVWAIAIVVLQLLMLLMFAASIIIALDGLQKIQSAMVWCVYNKTLRMRASTLSEERGNIVNLHTSESAAIKTQLQFASVFTTIPSLIALVVSLWVLAGLPGLVALGVVTVFAVLQQRISAALSVARLAFLAETDSRLRQVTDFISGIKLVRLMSWEDFFVDLIEQAREKEVNELGVVYIYRAAIIGISHLLAPFLSLAVFGTVFGVEGGGITAESVFPVLMLLNQLRGFMTNFALAVSKMVDMFGSFSRFGAFLLKPEQIPYAAKVDAADDSNPLAIEMVRPISFGFHNNGKKKQNTTGEIQQAGKTQQQPTATAATAENPKTEAQAEAPAATTATKVSEFVPILSDIKLDIRRGEFTCLVGPTASGRSTLLTALVGEADVDPEHLKWMMTTGGNGNSLLRHYGGVAFCAQEPHIQNRTLRENVISGSSATEFDPASYAAALVNSALLPDLAALPGGDNTEIGERGVSVSGGQRARIALARALYASSSRDIFLFDDVLSAVDSHVAVHIIQHALLGHLAGKTRVLVSHNLSVLPFADRIVALKDRQIVFDGTHDEYLKFCEQNKYQISSSSPTTAAATTATPAASSGTSSPKTPAILHDSSSALEQLIESVTNNVKTAIANGEGYFGEQQQAATNKAETAPAATSCDIVIPASPGTVATATTQQQEQEEQQQSNNSNSKKNNENARITKKETMATGAVTFSTYMWYAANGGLLLAIIVQLGFAAWRVTHLMADYALSFWTAKRQNVFGKDQWSNDEYFYLFLGLCLATGVAVFARQAFYTWFLYRAAKTVHTSLLRSVARAPMIFFEQTPMGQLTNRFSSDLEKLDVSLAEELVFAHSLIYLILSQIVVMCVANPIMIVVVVVFAVIYFFVRAKFAITLRNVRRLENTSRSPVLSILNETLGGIESLRAYGTSKLAEASHTAALAKLLRCGNSFAHVQGWVNVRVAFIGAGIVFCMAFLLTGLRIAAAQNEGFAYFGSDVSALGLTYAMTLTTSLNYFIVMSSTVVAQMSSAERLREYTDDLPQEKSIVYDNDDNFASDAVEMNEQQQQQQPATKYLQGEVRVAAPPSAWLTTTNIETAPVPMLEFRDVCMRYRPNLPLVLKKMNFSLKPGETCGVVGQTASGKSSVNSALFRLVDICDGHIFLAGRDIFSLTLKDLRRTITVVSQEALNFSGTLRSNLDPFNESSDEEVLRVLQLTLGSARLTGSADGKQQQAQKGDCNSQTSTTDAATTSLAASSSTSSAAAAEALKTPVSDRGANLSQGERQLLAIARAILTAKRRNARVLFLDEATAATDGVTDEKIQRLVRTEFPGATIIAIAHRLRTVADFDKVLVVKDGAAAEFDSPHVLLDKRDSLFSSMVAALGAEEEAAIRAISREAAESRKR